MPTRFELFLKLRRAMIEMHECATLLHEADVLASDIACVSEEMSLRDLIRHAKDVERSIEGEALKA